MLSKNEIKYIQSLYHKKTRDAEGVFVVEGPKIAAELLGSGYRVRKIYATEKWAAPSDLDTEVVRVTGEELQRLSGLQVAHEVLVVAEQEEAVRLAFDNRFTLVLDGIQDPGNFGTIIRIADWFGIKQVIAGEHTVELYNPKAIQSTMGSFVRVNVYYGSLVDIISGAGVPVYGAVLNGKNVFEAGKIKEGILVIGNEGRGINDELRTLITEPLTIPRYGGAESLNAAVATGIILSHVVGH
ncbi:MAG: methyltransferase [Chitinophagaceae bacterium]|jgi:TrmH family RNA methyltransferase|nr:methyltransferase [Chitinophagaceae bacterium]